MSSEVADPHLTGTVPGAQSRRERSAGALRFARTATITTALLALLGAPAGLLWSAIAPRAVYVIRDGETLLIQPDTQALISADGWFAVITAAAGLICGIAAYVVAGRFDGIALITGLTAGGVAAAFVTWGAGHLVGLETYNRLVKESADGTLIEGVLDLHAGGVVVAWSLLAVVTYAVLEALDIARRDARQKASAAAAAEFPYAPGSVEAP